MPRNRNKSNLEAARARMYRELIFESAERLFAEPGFDDCTVQDVCAEAGISLNTLYHAFKGKQEIYDAILAERGMGFMQAVKDGFEARGSVSERFETCIHGITRYLLEHRDYFRILLRRGQGWGIDPHGANSNWKLGISLTSELIRQGIEEGLFFDGDVDIMAVSVQALMQAQLAGRFSGDEDADVEAVADAVCRDVMRFLRRREDDETPRRRVA